MTKTYYLDTCIWRDFFEERVGPRGKPIGSYAYSLFMKIFSNRDKILFSEILIYELKKEFSTIEIEKMLKILFLTGRLERVNTKEEDYKEAKELAKQKNIPTSDALHVVLARNNGAILISRDKHLLFSNLTEVKRPEEI